MITHIHHLVKMPGFYVGLVIRLIAITTLATPRPIAEWYAPFMQTVVHSPSLDPWAQWLTLGGDNQAFPYGLGMLAVFSPMAALSEFSNGALDQALAYRVTLFIFDLALLFVTVFLSKGDESKAIEFYWLSPIVLGATYLLGLNDIVPIFFLTLAIVSLRAGKGALGGILFALSISVKLSMLLALPVFLILVLRNKAVKKLAASFLVGFGPSVGLLLGGPFLLSPASILSISGNREVTKIWEPTISLGVGPEVLLVPLVYLMVLYRIWRVRRLNFELLSVSLGLVFLAVVLSTSSSPGWYLWVLPFLISVRPESRVRTSILVWGFGLSYSFAYSTVMFETLGIGMFLTPFQISICHTSLLATGVLLALQAWRDGIKSNRFFVLSERPFAIGIAGDSGVGKDTFASALQAVLGDDSTVHLSGDNYHLWDRRRPMWKAVTHLNPATNDLTKFEKDSISLLGGRGIQVRHYNHSTGIYEREATLASNDFVIVSGLHTLQLPSLSRMLDVSVFLEMHEGLRQFFKIRRDVYERGHSLESVQGSIDKRMPDATKYIVPQRSEANLVFTVLPANANYEAQAAFNSEVPMKLAFISRIGLDEQELRRTLVSLAGVQFQTGRDSENKFNQITIQGAIGASDVELAAKKLAPNVLEFCESFPRWESGTVGLMQLIFVCQLEQVLIRRAL